MFYISIHSSVHSWHPFGLCGHQVLAEAVSERPWVSEWMLLFLAGLSRTFNHAKPKKNGLFYLNFLKQQLFIWNKMEYAKATSDEDCRWFFVAGKSSAEENIYESFQTYKIKFQIFVLFICSLYIIYTELHYFWWDFSNKRSLKIAIFWDKWSDDYFLIKRKVCH